MQECLGINKALQNIQYELVNNTSELTEMKKHIKKNNKNLKEVENDPTYSEEEIEAHKAHQTKIFKRKLQRSNKPKKRFLIKMHL